MKAPLKPEGKPGVVEGDQLYFQHPEDGPSSGKVSAVGEHGCTVEHKGAHHKVPWSNVLGHKVRAQRTMTLIERGDDGGIATDDDGKRHFIRGPLPLQKSFGDDVLARAQVDALLIGAGLMPSLDYIRAQYGEHWSLPAAAPTIDVPALIEDLRVQVLEVARAGAENVDELKKSLAALARPNGDES